MPSLTDLLSDFITVKSVRVVNTNTVYSFSVVQYIPENGDFQLLVTDGLRNNRQDVNADNEGLEFIELYFSLPEYWDLSANSWPIIWLDKLGEIPQKNKTWYGFGDTIPAGNPPKPVHESFGANHFILSKPILHEGQLSGENWKDMPFQLLAVIPIFQSEIDYKLKNSHTMFLNKFKKKHMNEQVDIFRKPCYKSRFFGMFG